MAMLHTSSWILIMRDHKTLEKNSITHSVQQVLNQLEGNAENLSSFLGDWSSWDDTYDYVTGSYEEYIDDNLMDGTFVTLGLGLILIRNDADEIVYAKQYELDLEREISVSDGIYHRFGPASPDMIHGSAESVLSGIALIDDVPMLFASRPILGSNDEGPPAGAMVMGIPITKSYINDLGDRLQLDMKLVTDQSSWPESLNTTELGIAVIPIDRELISGYGLVSDVNSSPGFVIRVSADREIMNSGIDTIFRFVASITVIILALGAAIFLFLERAVLSRITQLDRSLGRITEKRDLSGRVIDRGTDELATLGTTINTMLATLEHSQNELKATQNELEDRVDRRTAELRASNTALEAEIHEREIAEEKLSRLIRIDRLTGVASRTLFEEELGRAVQFSDRSGRFVAILFLDLDRFKNINDTLGHDRGDELLKSLAVRLQSCIRAVDTLGRWGGDEFSIILTELKKEQDAAIVADKVVNTIKKPFTIDGSNYYVGASVGISVAPNDGKNVGSLLKKADTAMYLAKSQGGSTYRYYAKEMDIAATERLDSERLIRRGLDQNEFLVYYQPQIDIQAGKITGVEALVRWEKPDEGIITPDRFARIAEETGLIVPISERVLETSCNQVKSWMEMGLNPITLSVNVAAQHISKNNFPEVIGSVMSLNGLDPASVQIEITEDYFSDFEGGTDRGLDRLKSMGLKIAIDDFGKGFSSLSYLKNLPLDTLKIDRSFLRGVPGDLGNSGIIEAILTIGTNLKLSVVAEGVEYDNQVSFLRSSGCTQHQGFFYSPPVCAEEMTKLLIKNQGGTGR